MAIQSLNAIIESLKNGYPVTKVFISNTRGDRKIQLIKEICQTRRIPFQWVPPQFIERKAGKKNQGVYAEISPVKLFTVNDLLEGEGPGLILILDHITDSGNLGAIIRSAAAANIRGIIIPKRHAAPINEQVWTSSAGALARMKIALSGNLTNDINRLKENHFWIVGTAKDARLSYYNYDFRKNTAVIVGNENKGLSPLLTKNTDEMIVIPLSANVESLNVSVAVGIILFEANRQRTI